MQIRQLSLFLSLLLTLCLFHDTEAQQAGQIESMKLLTADTGWAATVGEREPGPYPALLEAQP